MGNTHFASCYQTIHHSFPNDRSAALWHCEQRLSFPWQHVTIFCRDFQWQTDGLLREICDGLTCTAPHMYFTTMVDLIISLPYRPTTCQALKHYNFCLILYTFWVLRLWEFECIFKAFHSIIRAASSYKSDKKMTGNILLLCIIVTSI